jgi:cysteine synthase A
MESLNPGGTGKDRVAKSMLQEALSHPRYRPGVDIVEGTSGSTGIALACLCRSMGAQLHVVMPDDQSNEKKVLLEKLGAKVMIVPSCGIANSNHYVNSAKRLADDLNGIFLNQFENLANYRIHYATTGPEIWNQCHEQIDGFVMSSGTGGTIAGVATYLKERNPFVKIVLADPEGSSLFNKVKYGVCFTKEQKERGIRKHRYDSIVEGVGLDRTTANFAKATQYIDDAYKISDQDVIDMAHWMLKYEGLFIGSSSALNLVATVRFAQSLKQQQRQEQRDSASSVAMYKKIVTVICDSGHRHLSRLWNPEYIGACAEAGLYGSLQWPNSSLMTPERPPGLVDKIDGTDEGKREI